MSIQKHGSRESILASGQLAMFMSAREIQSAYQPLDGDRQYRALSGEESAEHLYERKAGEAEESGLAGKIRAQGVLHPVHLGEKVGRLGKPMVVGGHHRIAVMGQTDPDALMPVLHHEDIMHAKFRGGSTPWGGYR